MPQMDEALSAKTRDEWGEIFDEVGLIWGPVLALHEVAADRQAEAIGLFPEIESESIGTYRTVNVPFRFKTADVRPRGPSPTPGADTKAVLERAGFAEEEISSLFGDDTVR